MTIQDLGSLGELIAAVATIVTLAYLAVQIRSNTIATRSEANRSSRAETGATVRLIAGDEALATIFTKGLSDPESLDPIELVRFRFLLAGFISPLTAAYKEWRLGVSDESELQERVEQSRTLFLTPGGRWFWRKQRESYEIGQREYFDTHLVRLDSTTD